MKPPVEIRDRSEYRRRMNSLLRVDRLRTVVVTVDMQNEYLDMNVATSPVAPEEARRVINHAKELLDFARQAGLPVIHAYVKRRPIEVARGFFVTGVMTDASRRAGLSQNAQTGARKGPDRIEGTPTAEIPSELVASGDIHVTTKRSMDAFLGTDLETLVARTFNAETVVLAGINTDTCVYSTAFSAQNRGYQTVVISDCVASMRGIDHHWMALELMSRSIAWVMTVDEFKAKLQAARVLRPAGVR